MLVCVSVCHTCYNFTKALTLKFSDFLVTLNPSVSGLLVLMSRVAGDLILIVQHSSDSRVET